MVKCDFCSDEVDYLPFTCRYCGKSYCKKHRIPENHECSFEFRHDPYKVKSRQNSRSSTVYSDQPPENYPRVTSNKRVRTPRIRDRTNRTRPQVTSLLGMQAKPYGTYGLMIANAVFFSLGVILAFFNVDNLIFLSLSDYIGNYNYWTFITSIFTPINPIGGYSGEVFGNDIFFGLLYLFIKLFMLYFIGRMIEARWGWRTLIKIYILSGLLTSIGILLVQGFFSINVISSFFPGIQDVQYQSSWGATMGLIAFIAMIFPQQQVTMFLYFIPIRVKMKNLLWILIGINLIYAIFSIIFFQSNHNPLFVQYLGGIAGILGGLIIFGTMRRNR